MNLTLEPLIPVGLIALAGAALALADLGPLWRVRALVATRRRVLISVFSLAAIAVALLPLLAPRIETTETRKATALVLLDASRSMATEDAAGGRARFAAASALADGLARSVKGAHWETRAFDGSLHAVPGEAAGARTALGDAIAAARVSPEAPAAIVVFSDGANTSGLDPVAAAREARAAGCSVYTVRVGSTTRTPPPRIASVEIAAPDRAALGARATVHVSAVLEGLGGTAAEVVLALDGKEIGRAPVEPASPRVRRDTSFPVSLDEAGTHRLVATVRAGTHEESASRAIRVLAGELSVALVDCPARWEHRYLRRALAEMPRVRLTRVDVWTAEPDARATEQAIAAIGSCDVVILGDLPRRLLAADLGRALLRAVDEDGKGLLLLGGRNAFAGALDLGLAPLLPAAVGDDVTAVARSFRPQETEAGRALLARALGVPENEVRETLLRMPALGSFEPLGTPRAGSTVLLESPGRRPLLVLGRWGLGRTAMLATDETWRWAFTTAESGPREAHQALVHELVTWLAARSAGLGAALTVAPRQERVEAGATLAASVSFLGSTATAAAATGEVAIRATLEDAHGTVVATSVTTRGKDGEATVALPVPAGASGELVLRAVALDAAGRELARDERVVTAVAGEKEERVGEPADADLLVRIADAGGGAPFAEEDVTRGDARSVLAATFDPARREVRATRPLASGASHVLFLALFLSASWGLRRGAGLR